MRSLPVLVLLFPLVAVKLANCYDAETEMKKRTEHLDKMCNKFTDPKRPESEVRSSRLIRIWGIRGIRGILRILIDAIY